MEDWQLEFEWLRVRNEVKEMMNYEKPPEFQAVLLLVGIQELGFLRETWTKEEKRDLMNIAVCKLMSQDGHYEFSGYDADGWPHYELRIPIAEKGVKEQETALKKQLIRYFDNLKVSE